MTKAKTSAVTAAKKTTTKPASNLPKFTIRQLLEAGVHFGHKTMRRNTKMSKHLFGVKNGMSIFDLRSTATALTQSLQIVKDVAKNNGRILFVATKKQASDVIAQSAQKCGQYYVNHRWLGGMLTNWKTVSKSIKTLRDIEAQLANNELGLNKKERLVLTRKQQKLEDTLGGIKDMGGYPDLVFIIDSRRENLAVAEAKIIGVPVMAVVDSNCNPDNITHIIPGNDDSIKSIKLYCHLISEAILAGMKENMAASGVNLEKVSVGKAPVKEKLKIEAKKEVVAEKKVEEKPAAKKVVAKKAATTTAKTPEKTEVKKPAAKKTVTKKVTTTTAAKPAAKKSAAKKPATKKVVTKK